VTDTTTTDPEPIEGQLVIDGMPVPAGPHRTRQEWGEIIREDLGRTVTAIVDTGRHLIEAKADLDHGDWLLFIEEDIPFSERIVQMYMAVARHPGIANPKHVSYLPPHYSTLHELIRLDPGTMAAAIDAGDITAALERKDAAGIVVEWLRRAAIEAARSITAGQWWRLGNHLLYPGDSTDDEFVSRAHAAKAPFAFADPPYVVGKAEWDVPAWHHDWLCEAADVVAVTPGISEIARFMRATHMPYRWSVACHISNAMGHGTVGWASWIYVALFSSAESVNVGLRDHMTVTLPRGDLSTHETPKPAGLLVNLIEAFTDPGQWVIEPFLGSGTTLFAAEQTGRQCVAAEINIGFAAEAIMRFQRAYPDAEVCPL
jgi:hypothetical protein